MILECLKIAKIKFNPSWVIHYNTEYVRSTFLLGQDGDIHQELSDSSWNLNE